jgi:DUF1365 family protein
MEHQNGNNIMDSKKQKYAISSFKIIENTYVVEAETLDEAMELAMEMKEPTASEVMEEGFYDAEEITLN